MNNSCNMIKNVNEIDELIEKLLIKINFIDDETYFVLKGKFYLILKNQNGSRLLQKCLVNTNQNIMGHILIEVY